MSSPSTQFSISRGMGIYEPFHQISMWGDMFKGDTSLNTGASTIEQVDARLELLDIKGEYTSYESLGHSRNGHEANRTSNKIQRRLAQNREAARKSRLRKKAYVQQLETNRLKLTQLEQDLERVRHQGVYLGGALDSSHVGLSGTVNSGIATFELEYAHWVEEQHRHSCELRNALQTHINDMELHILVESVLNHYYKFFRMKTDAAKVDVFYLMSGMWRTSVERFFLWIGGFRPSELLNVLMPQLQPLTDQQALDVSNLRQLSQQAEDALSQGMDKLQQILAQSIAGELVEAGNYSNQMATTMEKLEVLESFVNQADNLRQQTMQHMYRILTTRQAARGLLALGDYFHRFRALSLLWSARPRDSV